MRRQEDEEDGRGMRQEGRRDSDSESWRQMEKSMKAEGRESLKSFPDSDPCTQRSADPSPSPHAPLPDASLPLFVFMSQILTRVPHLQHVLHRIPRPQLRHPHPDTSPAASPWSCAPHPRPPRLHREGARSLLAVKNEAPGRHFLHLSINQINLGNGICGLIPNDCT